MAGFLFAKEGLNAGLVIRFEEGEEWIIGRDPETSYQVLEDPMVSRKHLVCRFKDEAYILENLSVVNPTTINGKQLEEPVTLQEGDAVQIGSDVFYFTTEDPTSHIDASSPPQEDLETPTIYEEADDLGALTFNSTADARWIIKVISGPNAGAEFGIAENSTLIIGKDPKTCDIVFQDLSVSREHAKIIADQDSNISIEDLNSLNKVLINGQEISEQTPLKTQDLLALGTTSFLIIDQQQTRETIVSPTTSLDIRGEPQKVEQPVAVADHAENIAKKHWKKMVIPIRHLVLAGGFMVIVILALASVFSLFKSAPITISVEQERVEIAKALKTFPQVEYSFNSTNGKIFILGHVMTEVDHQEMTYLLSSLPFLHSIEQNVIIDELVWGHTNALLMKTPSWRGVSLTSINPGSFVLRGYVHSLEDAAKLAEYMNINFPYLDKLDNQVVVENTLEAQIHSALIENNFLDISFKLTNGELLLSGRVPSNKDSEFNAMLAKVKKLKGVRNVKNLVLFTKPISEVIDLSSKYRVTGSSKHGNVNQYVVIKGKILSTGDTLDGMTITNMGENTIFLEKDGIKFRIQYNQP